MPNFIKHHRKLFISLGVLVILALPAVVYLNHWANTATSQMIYIHNTVSTAPPTSSYQSLQTTYFTSQVPASWHINQRPVSGTTKVQVLAYAPAGSNTQAAFTSDLLPSEGLAGIGDYHLRTINAQEYPPFTDPSLPSTAKAFKSIDDPSAITVFMVHGSRYASVAVSGELNFQASLQTVHIIIDHWVWV